MRHKKLPLLLGIFLLLTTLSFSVVTLSMRSQVLSAPGAVTGLTATAAGKNRVVLKWNAVSGAEGYLVYGQKSGKYAYVGMTTQGTSFSDTKALDNDYNFYWVFAYIKDGSGKMITGGCEKYVYAKGVCAAVKNLKAKALYNAVILSWTASYRAEGYLIYGKTASGVYEYKGMTTQGTTWTDTKASGEEYNFYWVFPYHKNASGKIVVGLTGKYTYGKAKIYNGQICGLTAEKKGKTVKLTWSSGSGFVPVFSDAGEVIGQIYPTGYLIYRKIGKGEYKYLYKVNSLGFIDNSPSQTSYNYYKVVPYLTENGKIILGQDHIYVYITFNEPKAQPGKYIWESDNHERLVCDVNVDGEPCGWICETIDDWETHYTHHFHGIEHADGGYDGRIAQTDGFFKLSFTVDGKPSDGKSILEGSKVTVKITQTGDYEYNGCKVVAVTQWSASGETLYDGESTTVSFTMPHKKVQIYTFVKPKAYYTTGTVILRYGVMGHYPDTGDGYNGNGDVWIGYEEEGYDLTNYIHYFKNVSIVNYEDYGTHSPNALNYKIPQETYKMVTDYLNTIQYVIGYSSRVYEVDSWD